MPTKPRTRRTQEERTAETREALFDAAIAIIHEHGYQAASTSLIAKRAGVTRGAILHHFGTRAVFMAAVVACVSEREMRIYEELLADGIRGQNIYDWPSILLDVLGRPSGLAVLSILQASQSDPELAQSVQISQAEIEEAASAKIRQSYGGRDETVFSVMRLMVWAVRGLSIAERVMPQGIDRNSPIELLARLLKLAAPEGKLSELENSLNF